MSDSNSYGFGGKLIAVVILALGAGYLWACFQEGKSPLILLDYFKGKDEEAAPAARAPSRKETPSPAALPARKPEAARPTEPSQPKPAEPAPAPAAISRMYSAIDMSILFNETDDLLRRGKLFEARDRVANTSRLLVPPDAMGKFGDYEARVNRYHALLLETTKGGTIEMPKMTQLLIKNGGKLVVKVLSEDRDSITYETLTGIRSRMAKSTCEEIKPLEPVYGRVEVSLELKKQADYKGIVVEQEPGKPIRLREKPGHKATCLQIFDLADFCARNGANDKLVPLFDEALARDSDLLNTVHESKAGRMVDVLVYFLSIKATYDARKTLDLLKERYADTKAYKEAVANDAEFLANMEAVLNRRPSAPMAKIDRPAAPAPRPGETPAPTAPTAPEPAKPAEAPVVRGPDPADAPVRVTDPVAPPEVTSVSMPDGTAQKIADLVARGDRAFKEAMEHLNNSDPRIHPESAADEHKKALKLFMQANTEGYLPAQDLYKDGARVPDALLDRVRETQQRAFFCRKFAVASR